MSNDTITIIAIITISYIVLYVTLHFISDTIDKLKEEIRELKKQPEDNNNENSKHS